MIFHCSVYFESEMNCVAKKCYKFSIQIERKYLRRNVCVRFSFHFGRANEAKQTGQKQTDIIFERYVLLGDMKIQQPLDVLCVWYSMRRPNSWWCAVRMSTAYNCHSKACIFIYIRYPKYYVVAIFFSSAQIHRSTWHETKNDAPLSVSPDFGRNLFEKNIGK